MDPDNPTLRVEFEECLSILGSLGSECCQTHAAKVRDECGSFADERGFAAILLDFDFGRYHPPLPFGGNKTAVPKR